QRNETAGDLNRVKAQLATTCDVTVDGLRALGKHTFDETAGRDGHIVRMAELDDLADHVARHESERSPGKLEAIDEDAHRFHEVLEVMLAQRCVIRTADFGQAATA